MTKVKCSVDSCVFWEKDNRCNADAIRIDSNMSRSIDTDFSTEFAAEPGSGTGRKMKRAAAKTSAKTCCETMRPRGKEKRISRETGKSKEQS